jgi:hypothetical protein
MGYGLDCRGSVPGRVKIFLFYTASRPALGPTQPPIQCVLWALTPGVKRPGREADHLPPSSAEVKNDGAPLYVFMAWFLTYYVQGQFLAYFPYFEK